MPIDLLDLRADKGGDPEAFRASQRARFKDESLIDNCLNLEQSLRQVKYNREQLQKQYTDITRAIKAKRDANAEDPCEEEIAT